MTFVIRLVGASASGWGRLIYLRVRVGIGVVDGPDTTSSAEVKHALCGIYVRTQCERAAESQKPRVMLDFWRTG